MNTALEVVYGKNLIVLIRVPKVLRGYSSTKFVALLPMTR
jgi:hypothetical protein